MIENLVKKKKGESVMVTLAKKRIRNNLNMICMFTGKTGGGKTWSGISYSEELDPDFDVARQVVFDFKQTMDLINEPWFKEKKIKIVLWDEPQISISNRAWQSKMNKLVNYLLSTFRHQNIILILCAPYKDFLDIQTMKLLHWEFQCSMIDRKNNQCIVYPKYQQYNPQKKKTYPHSPYIISKGGSAEMKTWRIKKPSKEAIKIYEQKKTEFTAGLNKDIQESLDTINNPVLDDKIKHGIPKKPLTEKQAEVLALVKLGMTQTSIAKKLGRNQSAISQTVAFIKKKLILENEISQ